SPQAIVAFQLPFLFVSHSDGGLEMLKTTARFIALGLLLLLPACLMAQTTRGTIAGVVTDAQGAVVTGAKISATPVSGGEPRSTTSGPNGEYRIESLNPGNY